MKIVRSKNKIGRPRVDKPKQGSRIAVKSANWRLVISNLIEYKDSSFQQLMDLKYQTLELLNRRQKKKYDLRYYHIALERHLNGVPHLDILLIYSKSVRHNLTHFDYLLKHGNITTYRKLNQAIIDYGKKEDKDALSNLPDDKIVNGLSVNQLIEVQQLQKDPYAYLYDRMKQNPLQFNLEQYVQKNELSKYITSWSAIKAKLKDMQIAAANLLLKNKPGFRYIDRALIQSLLTPSELQIYDSWTGYQTIVNKLNELTTLKSDRDPKTLNLLITGPPNCGKSALVWHPKQFPPSPYNPLSSYCSIYPIGMSQWFPKYQSGVYHCIYWNQAKLTSYSYDTILKLLDGSPLDLTSKGSVSRKVDNPLIIMTSNLTLEELIHQKFSYDKFLLQTAKKNLAVRIQNVIVPDNYDLFLLQKLLLPRSSIN